MKTLARLLAFAVLCLAVPARGATYVVAPDSPGIQDAIDQAALGDTVLVQPGTYFECLLLKDGVHLVAASTDAVTVNAENDGPVLHALRVGSGTTVTGFRFVNGSAEEGGGLQAIASSAVFRDCTFAANNAARGGGVHLSQGSGVTFENCWFDSNVAGVGGGMYLDFSRAIVNNSFVVDNLTTSDGSAISANNASEAQFNFVCIYGNQSLRGATIACIYASPVFTNCTVTNNTDAAGFGVFALRGSGSRLERSIVAFNTGPALVCTNSNPWVGCSDFYGNASETLCGGDQGTNFFVDPLFCSSGYLLQSNSPLVGTSCGTMGAHGSTCPALTVVESVSWGNVKARFRN